MTSVLIRHETALSRHSHGALRLPTYTRMSCDHVFAGQLSQALTKDFHRLKLLYYKAITTSFAGAISYDCRDLNCACGIRSQSE